MIPRSNLSYGVDDYKRKLKDIGFKLTKFEFLGDRVLPGYCNFNLTLSVMREQAKVRGPFLGYVGGPMIDIIVKRLSLTKLSNMSLLRPRKKLSNKQSQNHRHTILCLCFGLDSLRT